MKVTYGNMEFTEMTCKVEGYKNRWGVIRFHIKGNAPEFDYYADAWGLPQSKENALVMARNFALWRSDNRYCRLRPRMSDFQVVPATAGRRERKKYFAWLEK